MAAGLSCFSLAGCADDEPAANAADDGSAAAVSWHNDIVPLVSEKCLSCHQSGGIAPFSMEKYADAKGWAKAMAGAVERGSMPPFLADETESCQPRLPWYRDLRLSSDQKRLLRSWADSGAPEGRAPEGKSLELPPLPKLDREDIVIGLPEPIHVEGDRDIHTCVVVDPGLEQDSYVKGRMITAGNARVLHHVVSYIIQPGKTEDGADRSKAQLEAAIRERKGIGIGGRYDCFGGTSLPGLDTAMLDGWAPGALPNIAPPDSAQPIDKDALVLLDLHYHPTGEPQMDGDTKLALMLADEKPAMISRVLLLGNAQGHQELESGIFDLLQQPDEEKAEFFIPADVSSHVEEMTWQWKLPAAAELRVSGMGTHMHYVGRDMRVMLEHAGGGAGKTNAAGEDAQGDTECLIQTPRWNFNWQRGYAYNAPYEELPLMKNGDTLRFHCIYDNTMQNHFVAQALSDRGLDSPVSVRLGEDTLDEMCVAAIGIMYPNTN